MKQAKAQWLAEHQKSGEVYAGLILGQNDEPDHHVFLIAGEIADADWKTAMDWAKKQGGELPTRREQSLLFANLKHEFKTSWYWSGEKHASGSSAWLQLFLNGVQGTTTSSYQSRARAVRRLVIQ